MGLKENKNSFEAAKMFRDRLIILMQQNASEDRGEIKDDALAEKRAERGLLVSEIAEIAKTSRGSVSGWLNPKPEKHHLPQTDSLQRLADAFGVSTNWLLGLESAPTTEQKNAASAFSELGVSYEAFRTLNKLKEQGAYMPVVMKGINKLLSFPTITKRTTQDADTNMAQTSAEHTTAKYSLEVLDALGRYFYQDYPAQGQFYHALPLQILDEKIRTGKSISQNELDVEGIYCDITTFEEANYSRLIKAIRDIRIEDIRKQYKKFKKDGVYDSELAETEPQAAAIAHLYHYYCPFEED